MTEKTGSRILLSPGITVVCKGPQANEKIICQKNNWVYVNVFFSKGLIGGMQRNFRFSLSGNQPAARASGGNAGILFPQMQAEYHEK